MLTLPEVRSSVKYSDSKTIDIRRSVTCDKISDRNLKTAQEQNTRIIRYKQAFTLSEVLITLGVIGIVTAITIPALINKYQKKVMATRLKESYVTITNTIRQAEYENGLLKSLTPQEKGKLHLWNEFVKLSLEQNLKGATYARYNRKSYPKTYPGYSNVFSPGWNRDVLCLQNGSCLWSMGNGGYIEETNHFWLNYLYVIVDLNGLSGPNRVGHDIFYFAVHFKDTGTIIDGLVYGVKSTQTLEQLYKNCKKTGSDWDNGRSCTEIVIRNNWEIPNIKDYPW